MASPLVLGETVEKKTPKRITPIPVPRDDSSSSPAAAAKTPRRIQPTLISSSPSVLPSPTVAEPPAQETPKAKKRIALQGPNSTDLALKPPLDLILILWLSKMSNFCVENCNLQCGSSARGQAFVDN